MAAETCPATGYPCEIREVCVNNREAYAAMLEATTRIEDSFLGRVVGFARRFRSDLEDMPHFVEMQKAEAGIKATDEVLARDCLGEESCVVQEAYNHGELQVFPLAD